MEVVRGCCTYSPVSGQLSDSSTLQFLLPKPWKIRFPVSNPSCSPSHTRAVGKTYGPDLQAESCDIPADTCFPSAISDPVGKGGDCRQGPETIADLKDSMPLCPRMVRRDSVCTTGGLSPVVRRGVGQRGAVYHGSLAPVF